MSALSHVPVMLGETLELFDLKPGMTVVDGTLGLAGHAREFCARIAPGGTFIGLDWDETMLAEAKQRLAEVAVTTHFVHTDYRDLAEFVRKYAGAAGADRIFLDLGLNNAQITDPARGISFLQPGPLDMRMDRSQGETAAEFLNTATVRQIETVLKEYGDERWAKRIAEVIVDRRKVTPLATTQDLVDCVMAAVPPAMRDKRIHPATRTFQAVRIYVNVELDGLEEAIEDAAQSLALHGVMVVLSYHSGEDRATKVAFRGLNSEEFEILTKKPLVPSPQEVANNSKSRSCKLRALRRKAILNQEGHHERRS
ncbi:MAG: 16S rRNA (cytosine(1402)-N(4))-methyltransferase RsmH [Chthonomonas sp.]|nr:16S rRNA (cytosine(1402)-N(4))-methyltransferase RsmH [Chthonomonas sp.]